MSDTGFTELRTRRLVLRRLQAEDAATLAAYRSDPDVARYQGWDTPYRLDQALEFIAALARTHPDTPGEWFQLAVVDGGRHIGDVALFVDGDDARLARIGFTLAPDVHGHGYATEAVVAALDYLFARGKHRVSADCDTRNHRSAALLERVGMRREAHHLASGWWKGEWTDEYVYAVLAEEWEEMRRVATPAHSAGGPVSAPAQSDRTPVGGSGQ
jgi:aminoglycoside 6'-N-acetyltransferase